MAFQPCRNRDFMGLHHDKLKVHKPREPSYQNKAKLLPLLRQPETGIFPPNPQVWAILRGKILAKHSFCGIQFPCDPLWISVWLKTLKLTGCKKIDGSMLGRARFC